MHGEADGDDLVCRSVQLRALLARARADAGVLRAHAAELLAAVAETRSLTAEARPTQFLEDHRVQELRSSRTRAQRVPRSQAARDGR